MKHVSFFLKCLCMSLLIYVLEYLLYLFIYFPPFYNVIEGDTLGEVGYTFYICQREFNHFKFIIFVSCLSTFLKDVLSSSKSRGYGFMCLYV